MSGAKYLLARLNASSVDLQCSTRSTIDNIAPSDIAAALAGLSKGPYLLARFLWCEDYSVTKELYGILLKEILQIANRKRWDCKIDSKHMTALVNTIILDLKNTSLCKPCGGTGIKVNQTCLVCCGTGNKKRSQAEIARLCGVNPTNWKRSWEQKYHDIYLRIIEWNDLCLDHLSSRLYLST